MPTPVYVRVNLALAMATIDVPGTRQVLTWTGVTRTTTEQHIRGKGWELVPDTHWSLLSPPDGFKRPVRRIQS